ncbi:MAG: hypothetical protein PHT12_04740 [Patescibacteria group bacterium]|nr:hypothetical protein [Patescibacteria group bacterium]
MGFELFGRKADEGLLTRIRAIGQKPERLANVLRCSLIAGCRRSSLGLDGDRHAICLVTIDGQVLTGWPITYDSEIHSTAIDNVIGAYLNCGGENNACVAAVMVSARKRDPDSPWIDQPRSLGFVKLAAWMDSRLGFVIGPGILPDGFSCYGWEDIRQLGILSREGLEKMLRRLGRNQSR